mgnify:CR=1 FL=1
MISNFFLLFLLVFIFFLIFDMLWFGTVSYQKIYKQQFLQLNSNKFSFRKLPAIITYVILSLGLSVLLYYQNPTTIVESICIGLLYGFVVYSVYNGTNYSTIEKYSLKTTIVDTLWGTILCGVLSTIIFVIDF